MSFNQFDYKTLRNSTSQINKSQNIYSQNQKNFNNNVLTSSFIRKKSLDYKPVNYDKKSPLIIQKLK